MRRTTLLLCLLAPVTLADWTTGGGGATRSGLAGINATSYFDRVLWNSSRYSSYGQQVYICDYRLVTYRYDFTNGPIVCHDLVSGYPLWERDLGAPGGRSLPIGFRDGQVYAVELDGAYPDTLYCLEDDSGTTLWTAALQAHVYLSESVTFAEDGDIIVSCEDFRTARIDRETGDTVWTTPRVWPVSGSADLTVSGDRFYGFGGALVGGNLKVYAFDLATGRKLDSTLVEDTHPGGTAPYGNIIAGPDGVLYAHRCGDNVTAIEDHGDSLHVRWVHEVSADPAAMWAQLACGPDSSVYVLSNGRVFRLDPLTGEATDSSPLIKDPTAVFAAHLAVGANGNVYAANGGYAGGALHAFWPDLWPLACDSIFNVSTSNPAISDFGFLAIAGGGSLLKVYDSPNAVAEQPARGRCTIRAWPNPFGSSVRLSLDHSTTHPLQVLDVSGRLVRTLVPRPSPSDPILWDGRDDAGRVLPAGAYLCRAPGVNVSQLVVKQ